MTSINSLIARGAKLQEQHRYLDAVKCFDSVVTLSPTCIEAHARRAHCLLLSGQALAAIENLCLYLKVNPQCFTGFYWLGNSYKSLRQYDQAIEAYQLALKYQPKLFDAWVNLGNLYKDIIQFESAVECYSCALLVKNDHPLALHNLAGALNNLGRREEALVCYEKILRLYPENRMAAWDLSLIQLAARQFVDGWKGYENRLQLWERNVSNNYPQWQGESLRGKRLMLLAEQGLGDQILFASIFGDVLAQTDQVVIQCSDSLRDLFSRSFSPALVIGTTEAPRGSCDYQIFFGSLGRYFRTDEMSFTARRNYLIPDVVKVEKWKQKISGFKGLKVGLNWKGSSIFKDDFARSTSLDILKTLNSVPGITWINLAVDASQNELTNSDFNLIDMTSEIKDFDDTAALVANLDLVISTCTSIPHLCGALGRPTWVLLHHLPYWIWGNDLGTSYWYPSVTCYRQHRPGDWEEVVQRVRDDLLALSKRLLKNDNF